MEGFTVPMGKRPAFDEIMGMDGDTPPRSALAALGQWLQDTPDDELRRRQEAAENTFRQLGIRLTPHQFRHLAGKLVLDARPGARRSPA